MWTEILNKLFGNFVTYLACMLISVIVGCYIGYDYTAKYYRSEILAANERAQKEKDVIIEKGDKLVADYVKQIDQLQTEKSSLQRQIPMALGNVGNDSRCVIPSGFVRLYNSSASGETTTPDSTDATPTTIDLATLLNILIENNEKYRQIGKQLIELQEFSK